MGDAFNFPKNHENSPLKHFGNKRHCNEFMQLLERDWNWAIRPGGALGSL
jgi:hypothetical protein